MSQSLSKILTHLVFSTKQRQDCLDKQICDELYPYIIQILKNNDCYHQSKIGGTTNHIHILCSLPKTISTSTLIEKIKSNSSKWIKTKGKNFSDFSWQKGYGAFSISPAHAQIVTNYIANQEIHHKKTTFEDEFLKLIKKYDIAYDLRYLFD